MQDPLGNVAADEANSEAAAPASTLSLPAGLRGTEETQSSDGGTRGPHVVELTVGGELDDYELLEEIARGGMGVVFKARQKSLNRVVALKMILAGQLAGEDQVRRFRAEAEAAARLDHPGIVPVYEVGEAGGRHFFSMGFVAGQSLAKRVAAGPLPPREAADLVKRIAEAVAYAHGRGVIHRDLKPGNVLLDAGGQPRVTDFGLAKQLGGDDGLTVSGQIMGTPSYMPPEQALGQLEAVGPRSDVYSLGAILYCLLAGRPPFQAASTLETINQVVQQEPVSPRQLNPQVPRDLETICLKCLEKDPARRYASAQNLADEAGRFLRGEPILARPVSRPARLWRWCRRNPAVATLTATAAAALVIGTVVSLILAGIADRNAELATQRATEIKRKNDELIKANSLAETKRQEAETNAGIAREQSQLALKSLEDVLFDIQRELINQPGAGPLRRKLVQKALARLDQVSQQFISQAKLDRAAAVGMYELGDLFLLFGSDVTGDADAAGPLASAGKLYQRGFEINQQLAAANPGDREAQRDLAISFEKLGNWRTLLGQLTEAATAYQRRLAIFRELANSDPSDARAKRDVGLACVTLSVAQLRTGQLSDAQSTCQEGVDVLQKLSAADPQDPAIHSDLSAAYTILGDIHIRSSRASEALAAYQACLDISQRMAKAYPDEAEAQRDLANAFDRFGDIQLAFGRTDEALTAYEECYKIRRRMAEEDPSDFQAAREFSIACQHLGDARLEAGQHAEALEAHEKGLELNLKLTAADPDDAQAQRALSVSYSCLGDVRLASDQIAEALAAYESSLQVSRRLADQGPPNAEVQRDLSVGYEKIAALRQQTGELDKALAGFQDALKISQELADAAPSDVQAQRDLSISHEKVGNVQYQTGQSAAALASYERSLQIRQALAAAEPDDGQTQRDLVVSYALVGRTARQAGDYAASLREYDEALMIARRLKEQGIPLEEIDELIAQLQAELEQTRLAASSTGDGAAAEPVDAP
jgi:serine/threonine protein kinase/tetratricopeptide (TPR) repeat protein